jgi:hypothetical protein
MKITVEFESLDEFMSFAPIGAAPGEKAKATRTKKEEKPGATATTTTAAADVADDGGLSSMLGGSEDTQLSDLLGGEAEPEKPKMTKEELRLKAAAVAKLSKDKMAQVIKLIESYKVKDLTTLPDDKINEMSDKLDKLK